MFDGGFLGVMGIRVGEGGRNVRGHVCGWECVNMMMMIIVMIMRVMANIILMI